VPEFCQSNGDRDHAHDDRAAEGSGIACRQGIEEFFLDIAEPLAQQRSATFRQQQHGERDPRRPRAADDPVLGRERQDLPDPLLAEAAAQTGFSRTHAVRNSVLENGCAGAQWRRRTLVRHTHQNR
jgi:hypothetical protein